MNILYNKIRDLIQKARRSAIRSVNLAQVLTGFQIGRLIVDDEQKGRTRAEYAEKTMRTLSERLTSEFGKGFSKTNLEYMRRFYLSYRNRLGFIPADRIAQTPSGQSGAPGKSNPLQPISPDSERAAMPFRLSWSHYLFLLTIDRGEERDFYEIEAADQNWSLKELKRQFDSALYERLALSRNKSRVKALSRNGLVMASPVDAVKDPYVLEFLGLEEKPEYSERRLETAIIDKLERFLLELGKGFLFQARQYRIAYDDQQFWVDLVFYNRLLRCFVLVDLKIGRLTHQDLGQMQMYANYFDRVVRAGNENPTIGIVLCKTKSDALVEMTLPRGNDRIFASKYQLYLPSKQELRAQISGVDVPEERRVSKAVTSGRRMARSGASRAGDHSP